MCTYSLTDYLLAFYLSYIPLHSLPQPRKYEWFLPDHKKEGIQRLVWFTYIDFPMGLSKRGWRAEGGTGTLSVFYVSRSGLDLDPFF
jgi:hypothetical protein